MIVLGIDPGTIESAFVVWDGIKIKNQGIIPNDKLLKVLSSEEYDVCVIEMMQSFGMAVGFTTFETLVWIGRFQQHVIDCGKIQELIKRGDIKMHHCNSMRAKDGNIAQSLRDKYGEKGTKLNQGVTYGLSSHKWQAFAVATCFAERCNKAKQE